MKEFKTAVHGAAKKKEEKEAAFKKAKLEQKLKYKTKIRRK